MQQNKEILAALKGLNSSQSVNMPEAVHAETVSSAPFVPSVVTAEDYTKAIEQEDALGYCVPFPSTREAHWVVCAKCGCEQRDNRHNCFKCSVKFSPNGETAEEMLRG